MHIMFEILTSTDLTSMNQLSDHYLFAMRHLPLSVAHDTVNK